jgi:catechol 2,3-dioxygenase-like lactoylglutathione lyase family enzyme
LDILHLKEVEMATYLGVDHVALETDDMEATVHFYNDVLGMKLVRTLRTGGDNDRRHYFFDAGHGNYSAFFDGATLPASSPQLLNHLSVNVDTAEEFDEAYRKIRGNGGDCTDIIERSYGKTFYFKDPNGIRLQLELQSREDEWTLEGDPDPVPSVSRIRAGG